jgi:pimeloyl-ACP methyl ester carboxylesterase
MSADSIVLIHGLWMTPLSWEHWTDRYGGRGYRVIAPAWPGMDVDIERLRRDPSPIARLTVTEIVNHYERLIREMRRPPIIMGHSIGGAFVQLLLDRGLGAAGVAIDSAPVRGVRQVALSTIRSTFPVLRRPANKRKAVPLTPKQFHYAFANALSEQESAAAYERYHVPAAASVLFESSKANFSSRSPLRVDFDNDDRAPLLFVAGGADHIAPPAANRANARLYRKSSAVTGYQEFPGRCHFTLGQEGWAAVADFALDWAEEHTTTKSQTSKVTVVPGETSK